MKKEKRKLSFKDIEVRAETKEDGKKTITGVIPYNSRSLPIFGVTEIIAPTAFNKTLTDKANVRALFNHDDSKVLGSTKSGTLRLENSDEGLICSVDLPNTSFGRDAFEIVSRGDVNTLSFGFIPQKWEDSNKEKTRTLKEVQLLETSFCVPFPAYPETTSIAYFRGLEKVNINIEALNDVLEKENFQDEDLLIIKNTVDKLNNLLPKGTAVEEKQEPEETTSVNDTVEKENIEALQLQIEAEIAA